MKTTMTLEEYDNLCDRLSNNEYKCGAWWPTVEEISKYLEPEKEKYIEFMLWVLETAENPNNEEEKESKKYLNKILRETLKIKFTDDYDEAR